MIQALRNQGAAWLLVLCVAGYPLVGLLAAAWDFPSLWASIPFRLGVAMLALGLAVGTWGERQLTSWAWTLLAWFGLYLVRLIYNVVAGYDAATRELVLFVLMSVIPVGAFLKADIKQIDWRTCVPLTCFSAAVLVIAIAGELLGLFGANSLTFTGRLGVTTVNPITLGHISATLLLSVVVLFWYCPAMHSVLLMFLAALGLAGLTTTNSRGPFIAGFVSLAFLVVTAPKKWHHDFSSRFLPIALLGLMALLFWCPLSIDRIITQSDHIRQMLRGNRATCTTADVTTKHDITKQNLNLIHEEKRDRLVFSDESAMLRLKLLQSSLKATLDNPLFGISNWETQFCNYPHNIILESFQNIGIFGGMMLVVLLLRGVQNAVLQLLAGCPLIPVLFIQAAVAAQVSGSLYAHAQLWVTLAILLESRGRVHGGGVNSGVVQAGGGIPPAWTEWARWPSGRLAVRRSCEAAPATKGDHDGRGQHGINRADAKGRRR